MTPFIIIVLLSAAQTETELFSAGCRVLYALDSKWWDGENLKFEGGKAI